MCSMRRRIAPSVTPAAPSVCPKHDLLDSMVKGRARAPASPCPSAPTSIGSPRGVPVPCTDTVWMHIGSTLPEASAVRIRALCDGPLGAVSPLDRPSCSTVILISGVHLWDDSVPLPIMSRRYCRSTLLKAPLYKDQQMRGRNFSCQGILSCMWNPTWLTADPQRMPIGE